MNMIEGLAAASSVLRNASDTADYIQYWRKFRGEQVDIRTVDIQKEIGKSDKHVFITHTIRGTIAAVSGTPAGFILEDVEETLEERKVSTMYTSNSTTGEPREMASVLMSPRRVSEKFVSFSSIEELELTEIKEGADDELLDLNVGKE